MGTWPGARLCELPAGGGPPASCPDPVARYPRPRVGVLPLVGGVPTSWGRAPTSPDGPVDGPVMASAAVPARPRQRGAVPGSIKAPRPASAGLSTVWTRRAATPMSSVSLTKPCVGPNQGDRARWGRGWTRPRRCRSMRTMSCAPLLSVTVVTSRFSRAGVHNPDVVSMASCRPAGTALRGRGRRSRRRWPGSRS